MVFGPKWRLLVYWRGSHSHCYGVVMLHIGIDGHVCLNSNHWLPCVSQARKLNFLFRLQQTNESCHSLLVLFSGYMLLFIYIIYTENRTIYMLPFKTENGSPGDLSVYCLLIVQTEVCCLSLCLRRNKWKWNCLQTDSTDLPCMHIGT